MFIPISDDNTLKSIKFQWVTLALIAFNVAVFAFSSADMPMSLIASFALVPAELFHVNILGGAFPGETQSVAVPEGTTLLTYMFIHGDIFHLVGNMLFLFVFGDNVEDAMGHIKFLAFYLLCGIVAGLTHAVMVPDSQSPARRRERRCCRRNRRLPHAASARARLGSGVQDHPPPDQRGHRAGLLGHYAGGDGHASPRPVPSLGGPISEDWPRVRFWFCSCAVLVWCCSTAT